MGTKDSDHRIVLQADVPGDDERVRAVLAGWGLEENSIYRLLTEGHPGHAPLMKQPNAARPDETATLLHGGLLPRGGYASH